MESNKENNYLYRERQSDNVTELLAKIQKMESGEVPKHELNEVELARVKSFETELFESKKKADSIEANVITLDLDFFETEAGKKLFNSMFGIEIEEKQISSWLMSNPDKIEALTDTQKEELQFQASEYQNNLLFEQLRQRLGSNGQFQGTEDIEPPQRISILTNPEKFAEKISLLLNLKKQLKNYLARLEIPNNNLEYGQKAIVQIYLKRINTAIAKMYCRARYVKDKEIKMGYSSLSVAERQILSEFNFSENTHSQLNRVDKFIFGASREIDGQGTYKNVSSELNQYAKEIDEERDSINVDESLSAKGLDIKKTKAPDISPEELKAMAEKLLTAYGIGPDKPDGWKYVIKKKKTFSVVRSKNEISGINIPKNIIDAITILLGHEIEGHVLQSENSSHIPLKIFEELDGGGRSSQFSEGGAMYMQEQISKMVFGIKVLPQTSYIKAIAERLQGGDFIDCIKVYFQSKNLPNLNDLRSGKISQPKYDEQAEKNLRDSIKNTKRIFKYSDLESVSVGILTNSKDTAYLEQRKILQKMSGTPLFKLAFISGMNLETAYDLIDLGLIKLDEIQQPEFKSIKIWEEVRDKYLAK